MQLTRKYKCSSQETVNAVPKNQKQKSGNCKWWMKSSQAYSFNGKATIRSDMMTPRNKS